LISKPEHLADFTTRLDTHKVIGLDTEADSLHSYHEKVCLVQVCSPDGYFLVDPLAEGLDLSAFYASLTPHTVIIHGADYDLRLLGRHPSFEASDIFDTSIAARFLGLEQIGYAALVQKFFEVTLCKASQRADWGRRPLPPRMEEYALNDVRYLLPLAEILENNSRNSAAGHGTASPATPWCKAPASPANAIWKRPGGSTEAASCRPAKPPCSAPCGTGGTLKPAPGTVRPSTLFPTSA
jgi:Ribonuclease D